MSLINIKVPGKLFVIGEYAVMSSKVEAILIAINKFISINIEPTNNYEFYSSYGYFKWILDEYDEPQFLYDKLPHVKSAIYIAHKYLKYLDIKPEKYKLSIESELNNEEGKKYGLGSSGAVLVGVIKAILYFHGVIVGKQQLFKLCVLAQLEINDVTSGAELATSIYTGWVAYNRYDSLWLINNKGQMMELIDIEWPLLKIERLKVNEILPCVCYSGIDQSTKEYLEKISQKDFNSEIYKNFIEQAAYYTQALKKALVNSEAQKIAVPFEEYRKLLIEFQEWAGIIIESETLTQIIDCGNQSHVPSKVSGAGFGDCVIGLTDNPQLKNHLYQEWNQLGFNSLDLDVWEGFY